MMRTTSLQGALRAAALRSADGGSRQAILDRGAQALGTLATLEADPDVPKRTAAKLASFLDHVEAAEQSLGSRATEPAFLLNLMGEAMARSELINREVIEFLQVGLYFYGLEQVERRWPQRATIYLAIHADHLDEYVGRKSLKELVVKGQEKLAEGRPFCITYNYLNSLRKAYWQRNRATEDVLDQGAVSEVSETLADEAPAAAAPVVASATAPAPDADDRVGLMLRLFRDELTPRQRWIYLAKNRHQLEAAPAETGREAAPPLSLDGFLASLEEPAPVGDLGWTEVAEHLGINEKTAKREYLRALHVLLSESCTAVFGGQRIPSAYVRRILKQIRSVVQEKDLRLKSSTGRGMGVLVEKWEVALRFVLNHDHVTATAGR